MSAGIGWDARQPGRRGTRGGRGGVHRATHLFALSAFALAQPRQCAAGQDIWARLVRVQIDVFGRAFQRIFMCITRLVRASELR